MSTTHDGERQSEKPNETLVQARSPNAFMSLLCEKCALPEEVLSLAFLYMHQYRKCITDTKSEPKNALDAYTLSLAALSLSSKVSENLRRLREFLIPAWEILHPNDPALTFPSELYDDLRASLVAGEMLLLRVIRFNARIPQARDYLPRILDRMLQTRVSEKSSIYEAAESWLSIAARDYRLSMFYPLRALAVASAYLACKEAGLEVASFQDLTSNVKSVDPMDAREAVDELRSVRDGLLGS